MTYYTNTHTHLTLACDLPPYMGHPSTPFVELVFVQPSPFMASDHYQVSHALDPCMEHEFILQPPHAATASF